MVSGDGGCDSPGYSATYGTCTVMDAKKKNILAVNVVKVTEVSNSYQMENEGLLRCLIEMQVMQC